MKKTKEKLRKYKILGNADSFYYYEKNSRRQGQALLICDRFIDLTNWKDDNVSGIKIRIDL